MQPVRRKELNALWVSLALVDARPGIRSTVKTKQKTKLNQKMLNTHFRSFTEFRNVKSLRKRSNEQAKLWCKRCSDIQLPNALQVGKNWNSEACVCVAALSPLQGPSTHVLSEPDISKRCAFGVLRACSEMHFTHFVPPVLHHPLGVSIEACISSNVQLVFWSSRALPVNFSTLVAARATVDVLQPWLGAPRRARPRMPTAHR